MKAFIPRLAAIGLDVRQGRSADERTKSGKGAAMGHSPDGHPFWTNSREVLFATLGAGRKGLDSRTAAVRLEETGPNSDAPPARAGAVRATARRLLEPLCLML